MQISSTRLLQTVKLRWLARQDYLTSWQAMKSFTDSRSHDTVDEIWLLEHHPVFTQGQNGKAEHVLNPGTIPIVQTDRGGQVTYHGPGQLMVYTLVDLRRKKFNIRELVTKLETAVVNFLADYDVSASTDCKAPGVFVDQKKICSIGLRIRRGCSYHGLAFNVKLDLAPFQCINPCGFAGLEMTQLSVLAKENDVYKVGRLLIHSLCNQLGYNTVNFENAGIIDGK